MRRTKDNFTMEWLNADDEKTKWARISTYTGLNKLTQKAQSTAPLNKTCAFVQRLLEALKNNLEIKVR